MNLTVEVVGLGVPFLWLGMVVAISLLEAPLKFRAPGMTLAVGLSIGRLVFRALNVAEVALAVILIAACATTLRPRVLGWVLLGATCAFLATQILLLRPRLDRRALQIVAGHAPSPSRQHLAYIGCEAAKILLLVALGAQLLSEALS